MQKDCHIVARWHCLQTPDVTGPWFQKQTDLGWKCVFGIRPQNPVSEKQLSMCLALIRELCLMLEPSAVLFLNRL